MCRSIEGRGVTIEDRGVSIDRGSQFYTAFDILSITAFHSSQFCMLNAY